MPIKNGTICMDQTRAPEPHTFPYYMGIYVFPVVFAFGVVGNVLNLIVLNKMKTKTVCFLSAMVSADLCFFLAMFMINLSAYDSLAESSAFLSFYYQSKMTLLTLANWFSSASIWFVIMVTVERLVAIRTPLLARTFWSHRRLTVIIITIFILTLILQMPHFLWLTPTTVSGCTNPNTTTYVLVQLRLVDPLYIPLKYAIIICPVITVTIPLILLISLNSLLVYHMRLSRRNIKELGGLMNQGLIHENEIKITSTILIIVFTFFIFNFPSAIVFMFYMIEQDTVRLGKLITPAVTTNFLVTFSKALNFPLYCSSSSNFRTQVKNLFFKMTRNSAWRKLSTDTNYIVNSLRKKRYSRQLSTETNSTKRTSLNSDNGKRHMSLNDNGKRTSLQYDITSIYYDDVFVHY